MASAKEMASLKEMLETACMRALKIVPSRRFPKVVADLKGLQERLKKGPLQPPGAPSPRQDPCLPGRGRRLAMLSAAALGDEAAQAAWIPLKGAMETRLPRAVEPALDCVQKLIACGFIGGEADVLGGRPDDDGSSIAAMDGRKDLRRDGGDPAAAPNPSVSKPVAGEIIEAVCWAAELADERVELLVLKCLLTAGTSCSFLVHGEALLRCVRTCYNLFLGSRNFVNQMAAKATLTQLLTMVFRRMEADSPAVPATSIVVAELVLDTPEDVRSLGAPAVLQSVQALMNKVIEDITVSFNASAAPAADAAAAAFSADAAALPAARGAAGPGGTPSRPGSSFGGAAGSSTSGGGGGASAADEGLSLEGDRGETLGEGGAYSALRRDAFLVLRALCKLTMKPAGESPAADMIVEKGKLLSLHLVRILLDNAGPVFRSHATFVGVLKQYLTLSLLKNSSSAFPSQQLICNIFATLLARFRHMMKAEVGVFLPMLLLRNLEAPPALGPNGPLISYAQRAIVLRVLRYHTLDAQLLADLFVNYDCEVDSSNLFERIVNALVRLAQGAAGGPESGLAPAQDVALRAEAQQCCGHVLRALALWLDRPPPPPPPSLSAGGERSTKDGDVIYDGDVEVSVDGDAATTAGAGTDGGAGDVSAEAGGTAGPPSEEKRQTAEEMKRHKVEMLEGIALFNKKPKKGLEYLMARGKLGKSPEDVATFLRDTPGLNKTIKGDYLGEREDFSLKVMHAYVDAMNFEGQPFDEAIRAFLDGFRLPGEAQKIDRLMEKFAERYCKDNPRAFKSADTAYVLAYSVIMLNTDAHNPQVKVKMTKEGFLRNNRGIDDGADLPPAFMGTLYDRIVHNEIKMKGEPGDANDLLAKKRAEVDAKRDFLGLPIVPTKAQLAEQRASEQEAHIRTTQEIVREKERRAAAWAVSVDPDSAVPMLEAVWAPLLAAVSIQFDAAEDPDRVGACLESFRCGVHVAAAGGLAPARDAYVAQLAKFTSLSVPAGMRGKHVAAFHCLMTVAVDEGSALADAWAHVLRSVSRLDSIRQMAEGAPPDRLLFAPTMGDAMPPNGPPRLDRAASQRRTSTKQLGDDVAAAVAEARAAGLLPPAGILDLLPAEAAERVFVQTTNLSSEAIVDFVRALCAVSLEELKTAVSPRLFSLTKLVEVAHYNIGRIRLVWSRLWAVLTDHFVAVGCHPTLAVAIYVVDSLRQLAMKFLEREELANYSFQNLFLRPFVVLMRQSAAVPVREFIIRCVNQMVLARVAYVRSGWRSMFQVFSVAAGDSSPAIVAMAFATIERLVRDHFAHITATEVAAFTDCVSCLVAFTNVKVDVTVALNAIAFLRFCALKLAEGELGPAPGAADASGADAAGGEADGARSGAPAAAGVASSSTGALPSPTSAGHAAPSQEMHHFWFPLLAGLAELAFDPREDIRETALAILFDTLRFHGHQFSLAFWERVFDAVLMPMFDHVRPIDGPGAAPAGAAGAKAGVAGSASDGEWVYDTCQRSVQLVLELYAQFYPTVGSGLLSRVIGLLGGFVRRPHARLAAVGVTALSKFLEGSGHLFDDDTWDIVLRTLRSTIADALPDVAALVAPGEWALPMDAAEAARAAEAGPQRLLRSTSVSPGRVAESAAADAASPSSVQLDSSAAPPVLPAAGRSGPAWLRTEADVSCRAGTQLLLVQLVGELYARHGRRLSRRRLATLMDSLVGVHGYARAVNADRTTRARLRHARVAAGGGGTGPTSGHTLPDPPLRQLETEAGSAYLAMLMHNWSSWYLSAEEDEARVEARLVGFCRAALEGFVADASLVAAQEATRGVPGGPSSQYLMAQYRDEVAARGPVAVAVLKALGGFGPGPFARHLPALFPLLTTLIRCELAPPEVCRALSELFAARVGPLLEEALAAGIGAGSAGAGNVLLANGAGGAGGEELG